MYESQIARGAAALDAFDPWWRERVDADALDQRNCTRCVVGQALEVRGAGHSESPDVRYWHDALAALGAPPLAERDDNVAYARRRDWAAAHGFDLPPDDDNPTAYRRLTNEWAAYLTPTPTPTPTLVTE